MADWVDNYYDLATFETDGVSMGCRVKFPESIEKTASDELRFSVHVRYEDGEPIFKGLSMHFKGRDDG
jgi:hypothetical protein